MGRNISYPNQIAKLIIELSAKFPGVSVGKHLETITADCGSLEWLSDKELYKNMLAYMQQLEIAGGALTAIVDEAETARIINEGNHLFEEAETENED